MLSPARLIPAAVWGQNARGSGEQDTFMQIQMLTQLKPHQSRRVSPLWVSVHSESAGPMSVQSPLLEGEQWTDSQLALVQTVMVHSNVRI